MTTEIELVESDHMAFTFGRLDEMRRNKRHCNFLITVGSKEIHAHRNILAASSDYFDAMLFHDTKENQTGVVEMKDVDPECVNICVDYIYSGKASAPDGKHEQLMHVAHLMQLHKLCDGIADLFEKNLHVNSFFATRKIANMYNCKELEDQCHKYAERNFSVIIRKDEFGELRKDYVVKLINSNAVRASEEERLYASLRWIKRDPDRSNMLHEFLSMIELSEIPAEYKRYLAEFEPLISENISLFKMFSISIWDTLKVKSRDSRTIEENAIIVFDENSGCLQKFNPQDKSWVSMQEINEDMLEKKNFSAVLLDGFIYVLISNKSVFRLDYHIQTAEWEKLADMISDHGCCPPVAVAKGCIYVAGGHKSKSTASVERYEPTINQWVNLREKIRSTMGAELLAVGEQIYSFGGFSNGVYLADVERCDTRSLEWTNVSPMNEARGYVSACESKHKIYVAGGYLKLCEKVTKLNSVESYDSFLDTWTYLQPMNAVRFWFRSFCIDSDIYAVGGYYSSPGSMEKYDVEKNEWNRMPIPTGTNLKILESVAIAYLK